MYVDDGQLALTTVTWEPNVPDCVAPLLPVDQCLCPSIANRMTQCSSYVTSIVVIRPSSIALVRLLFFLLHSMNLPSVMRLSFAAAICVLLFPLASANSKAKNQPRGKGKNLLPFASVAEHSLLEDFETEKEESESTSPKQSRKSGALHSLKSTAASGSNNIGNGAKITKASHFNQPFQLGGKINILCIADGSPKPTITWYKDGAELVYKYNIHLQEQTEPDGKQRSRIEIDPATVGDQGVYSCVVHNKYGSMVKNFKSEYFY